MKIEELKALLEKATPAPWWAELWEVLSSHVRICEATTDGAVVEPAPVKDTFVLTEAGALVSKGGVSLADISPEEAETNAQLIAALRNMAPKLIAVAEAAQKLDIRDGPEGPAIVGGLYDLDVALAQLALLD